MWRRGRGIAAAAILLSDIALLYGLFLLFSFLQTGNIMKIAYLPWIIIVLAIWEANRILLRRPRSISFLIVLNIMLWFFLTTAGYFFFVQASGTCAWLAVAIMFAVTVGRAVAVSQKPPEQDTAIIYLEISVIFTLCFLLVQSGSFQLPFYDNLPCFLAIALNMASLLFFRLFGTRGSTDIANMASGILVLILLVILLLLGAVACSVIFLRGSTGLLTYSYQTAVGVAGSFINAVGRFMAFLAFLFPAQDGEMDIDPLPEVTVNPSNKDEMAMPDIMPYVLIVLGIAAVIYALIVLFRLRKLKIASKIAAGTSAFTASRFLLWTKLSMRLRLIRQYLNFELMYRRNFHTAQGLFVSLERIAAKAGRRRRPEETTRLFVKHLIAEGVMVLPSPRAEELMDLFLDELDRTLFAWPQGPKIMSDEDLRELATLIRKDKIIVVSAPDKKSKLIAE